ncbi:MAG: amidohydrolase family protein, partial [Deltaproteobacteria bacterium]|nr:amidohydrolase family protein [Deltaproteobacteria bacterium]
MADMIVEGGTVVTLDPKRRVIADGAVVVTGSKIEAVGNREKIGERYTADKVIRAQGKVLLPGLINTHTHIFQTLLKGIGPDLPTWEWFKAVLDPAVSHLTLEDCYISALLGSIEAIKSGTTCLLDYNYAHPHPRMADEVVRAFQQVGIRGILARGIIDMGEVHKNIVHETEEELEDCERLINQYDGLADGMVHVWLAPYSVRSTSWQGFKGAKELADRYGTGLTVHSLSPLAIESARELYGMDDLQFFENIGFLGPNV